MTVPLPASPHRILLVNPTRYLGNLLIAGKLIQDFAAHCSAQGILFRVVIDEAFAPLLHSTLPAGSVYWYPRTAIKKAGHWQKLKLYTGFLKQLRAFKADIAFNIEEDSTSDRLTRWSGAAYRLGCSTSRHTSGYSQVLPISFAARPAAMRHRWFSFAEVFAALGLVSKTPSYLQFAPASLSAETRQKLDLAGLKLDQPFTVIHAGATKDYKKWPQAYFAELARLLRSQDLQVVFIGAGQDAVETGKILELVRQDSDTHSIFDLTNQLTLAELGCFLSLASVMIGNDSGPFHLACAVGTPGVVIFGPTDASLWAPMGDQVVLLQKKDLCSPQCSRAQCIHAHRCLTAITPDQVLAAVRSLLQARTITT